MYKWYSCIQFELGPLLELTLRFLILKGDWLGNTAEEPRGKEVLVHIIQ